VAADKEGLEVQAGLGESVVVAAAAVAVAAAETAWAAAAPTPGANTT
jgi:hypothetical protein